MDFGAFQRRVTKCSKTLQKTAWQTFQKTERAAKWIRAYETQNVRRSSELKNLPGAFWKVVFWPKKGISRPAAAISGHVRKAKASGTLSPRVIQLERRPRAI